MSLPSHEAGVPCGHEGQTGDQPRPISRRRSSRCNDPTGCLPPSCVSCRSATKTAGSAVPTMLQLLAGSHLDQGMWTLRGGPAPRVMVIPDNFPEKAGSKGEGRVRKSLQRPNLSSASFPKRPLLGPGGAGEPPGDKSPSESSLPSQFAGILQGKLRQGLARAHIFLLIFGAGSLRSCSAR